MSIEAVLANERICPHNERVWIICWPSEYGIVPVESSCRYHVQDAWAAMEGGQELAEERGFVARRFWLGLTRREQAAGQETLF